MLTKTIFQERLQYLDNYDVANACNVIRNVILNNGHNLTDVLKATGYSHNSNVYFELIKQGNNIDVSDVFHLCFSIGIDALNIDNYRDHRFTLNEVVKLDKAFLNRYYSFKSTDMKKFIVAAVTYLLVDTQPPKHARVVIKEIEPNYERRYFTSPNSKLFFRYSFALGLQYDLSQVEKVFSLAQLNSNLLLTLSKPTAFQFGEFSDSAPELKFRDYMTPLVTTETKKVTGSLVRKLDGVPIQFNVTLKYGVPVIGIFLDRSLKPMVDEKLKELKFLRSLDNESLLLTTRDILWFKEASVVDSDQYLYLMEVLTDDPYEFIGLVRDIGEDYLVFDNLNDEQGIKVNKSKARILGKLILIQKLESSEPVVEVINNLFAD